MQWIKAKNRKMKFRDQSYFQVNAMNEKDLKSKDLSFKVISLSLENFEASFIGANFIPFFINSSKR